jgi:hypothetical protein
MDVERLRQVLRDLPGEVDKAAAQIKAVASQVEANLDKFAHLIPDTPENFLKDFGKSGPVVPSTRDEKIKWLVDNVDTLKFGDLNYLSDGLVGDIFNHYYKK